MGIGSNGSRMALLRGTEEVNMVHYIEKIAAGMRAMNVEPDAFTYFPEQDSPDFTYDSAIILGVPVLRCAGRYCSYGYEDYGVPFVPVWKSQKYDGGELLTKFRNAYSDA